MQTKFAIVKKNQNDQRWPCMFDFDFFFPSTCESNATLTDPNKTMLEAPASLQKIPFPPGNHKMTRLTANILKINIFKSFAFFSIK